MNILVCNDDGFTSPGIKAAVEAVCGLGKVTVVAPSSQQTGVGRSLDSAARQSLRPIRFLAHGRRITAYAANAAPARLVQHALHTIFRTTPPDLVVSGINCGENIGSSITASGTIGAALEAASYDVPALAVSRGIDAARHVRFSDLDWTACRHFTRYFAQRLLKRKMPAGVSVLNVNVPAAASPSTPWTMTRLSRQPYYAYVLPRPSKRSKFDDARFLTEVDHRTLESDSDIHAVVRKGIVSVTPLSLDLTSRVDRTTLKARLRR